MGWTNVSKLFWTRMHSSRMRTTIAVAVCWEGAVCLSECWDTSSRCGPGDPSRCGPGDRHRLDPSTSPLGVGLETCKACWDTTPQEICKACWDTTCNACWDTIPCGQTDTCKNITFANFVLMTNWPLCNS